MISTFLLQLIADSSGDLLEDLTEQKPAALTGPASTAARLKAHPDLIVNGSTITLAPARPPSLRVDH